MLRKRLALLLLTGLVMFAFMGCIDIDIEGGKVKVDGVYLKNERTIHFTNSESNSKFIADIYKGKVQLQAGSEIDLQVKIYEKTENDVSLFFKDGKLLGKTRSGDPYAIGSLTGTISQVEEIDIDSGAGNITIENMENKSVLLDTGAGNVKLLKCSISNINIDTGAGNIFLEDIISQNIKLDSGAGNIEISGVRADDINCDSGVGNISAYSSSAKTVEFDTGIGNISTSDCDFKSKDFSTGLGNVHNLDSKSRKHEGVEL